MPHAPEILWLKRFAIPVASALLILALAAGSAGAQTFYMQAMPPEHVRLGLRYLRSDYAGDADQSPVSGVFDVSLCVRIDSRFAADISIPMTSVRFGDEERESAIGNIYIGVQRLIGDGGERESALSFGVFFPTAEKHDFSAYFTGLFANYCEMQKYMPNTLTIYTNYSFRYEKPSGGIFGFEIGPAVYKPTGDNGGGGELYIHYGLSGGVGVSDFRILTELTGLFTLSRDSDEFSDRFVNALTFGARWTGSPLQPGAFYKFYLKDYLKDAVDGVLGLEVAVALR